MIPVRGWREILSRVKADLGRDHFSIIAAGVAFFALLALFPGLAALVSLYGLISDPLEVQAQLAMVSGLMPPAAYRIIETQLQSIARQSGGSLGFGFFGGLLLTLWSANKGVKALMEALNIAYEEKETRGFIKQNLLSLVFTFLSILFVVVTLAILVVTPALLELLPLPGSTQRLYQLLRWALLAVMAIMLLNFTYCYLPNRPAARWRWLSHGSFFAWFFWMLASALFSYYTVNFGNYHKTYGSLGAVVVLMMWFYLTVFIILLGGELNAELEQQTALDQARGESQPRGKRGA